MYEVIEDYIDLNQKRAHYIKGHYNSSLSSRLKLDEIERQLEIEGDNRIRQEEHVEVLKEMKENHSGYMKRWERQIKTMAIGTWNHEAVLQFFTEMDLDDYADYFKQNEEFDGEMLLRMNPLYLQKAHLTFEQTKRIQSALFLIENFRKLSDKPIVFGWTNEQVLIWLVEKGFGHLSENFKISSQVNTRLNIKTKRTNSFPASYHGNRIAIFGRIRFGQQITLGAEASRDGRSRDT